MNSPSADSTLLKRELVDWKIGKKKYSESSTEIQ